MKALITTLVTHARARSWCYFRGREIDTWRGKDGVQRCLLCEVEAWMWRKGWDA